MIAFRLTFFKTDFEPNVATNLHNPRKISKTRHIELYIERAPLCGYNMARKRRGRDKNKDFDFRYVERAVRAYQIVATPYFLLVRTIYHCQQALPAISHHNLCNVLSWL